MSTLVKEKAKSILDRYQYKPGPDKESTHYCPGCGHGNIHKMMAEAVDELGVAERTVLMSPVGCSVFAYYYFNMGHIQVAHGRAPAAATGVKRTQPHAIVLSYQGDGDLAAIGGNNILQAANRGENISVFFVNNAIYGMTGGQMAPTTLIGQRTSTTPRGRTRANEGSPIRVCELLASLEAPVYLERVALIDPKTTIKARKAIKKAIQMQVEGRGFSLVEVLSPCPTGWKLSPVDSRKWIEQNMLPVFPLGVYRDRSKEELAPAEPMKIETVEQALGLAEEGGAGDGKGTAPLPETVFMKVAGFGGQGILFLGEVLAESGMHAGHRVTWLPSYGPEMRGGTANCHVVISSSRIGSPTVSTPNVLVAMNRPSFEKFVDDVVDGGLLLYDSSLIEGVEVPPRLRGHPVPATKIADELGNTRVANVVMLGAYLGLTGIFNREQALQALKLHITRKHLLEVNEKALDAGMAAGEASRK
ncbi:MAG: 2-ketoisovalerate ferredoxin oxidoreductase [Candidatus Latescibacterota bacterium]|nr:MAG: 2-ketoisovalerate ferredoxin oxidoreductase [Candidatus Latescibacterota bacterium]